MVQQQRIKYLLNLCYWFTASPLSLMSYESQAVDVIYFRVYLHIIAGGCLAFQDDR